MTLETNFQSAGHLFKKSSLNGQSLLNKVEKVKKRFRNHDENSTTTKDTKCKWQHVMSFTIFQAKNGWLVTESSKLTIKIYIYISKIFKNWVIS